MAVSLARGYGSSIVTNPGFAYNAISYCISAAVITGAVALLHATLWMFYFRTHGNPEVHEVDVAASKLTLPNTMAYGTAVPTANPYGSTAVTSTVFPERQSANIVPVTAMATTEPVPESAAGAGLGATGGNAAATGVPAASAYPLSSM